jgi:serine/threonine-protein kinase HipA
VPPPVLGAFSLSGSQDKRLYVEQGGEFIAAPPGRGDWIAKVAPNERPDAAANELCATALAQAAGVTVAALKVVSSQLIELDTDAPEVLLARRIDRGVGTRTHIEDFAQVLGRFPEEKYCGADNYETIARIVNQLSVERLADALEFTRRIVVSVLLGNGAMHLKNIALTYREGRACALAPAFDIAATTLANGDDRLALALAGERDMRRISEATFVEYAACAELPPKAVLRVVRDTVKRAREQWPSMLYTASLAVETKRQILGRLVQLPIVGK